MNCPTMTPATASDFRGRTSVWMYLVLLIAWVPSGCSSNKVVTDYDRGATFLELRTYDWMPGPQRTPDDPRIPDAALDTRIRHAIANALAAKGYTRRTNKAPDFFIGYHAAHRTALTVEDVDTYYGYDVERAWSIADNRNALARGTIGGRVYAYRYAVGTLILDIVDPTMKHLMWRGAAYGALDADDPPEASNRPLRAFIDQMLQAFPPNETSR